MSDKNALVKLAMFVLAHPNAGKNMGRLDHADWEQMQELAVEALAQAPAEGDSRPPAAATVDRAFFDRVRAVINRINRRLEESDTPVGPALVRSWESDLHRALCAAAPTPPAVDEAMARRFIAAHENAKADHIPKIWARGQREERDVIVALRAALAQQAAQAGE